MKKYLLLLVFAFAATAMQAQSGNMYSLLFHEMSYFAEYEHMRQRDGDFISASYISNDDTPLPLGRIFYKMSPTSLTITDSLYIADTSMIAHYIFQNPHGEDNLRIKSEYHENCDSTFLRISHFPDNDLHSNPDEDIVTPLCEGSIDGNMFMTDCWGDLIMHYVKERDFWHTDHYLARFDIDGTLKHQALFFENALFGQAAKGVLQVYKQSPLKYLQWGTAVTSSGLCANLAIYEIDSLFNKNTLVLSSILSEEVINQFYNAYEYLDVDGETQVIPIGGDDILVAAKYLYDQTHDPSDYEYGAVVAKYDLRTMQQKGYIVFNDYSGNRRAHCLGLKMMTDGTVYFLYWENGYPVESIVVVKMDTDLNVEWKHTLKTENIQISPMLLYPILFEDEQGEEKGIAWVGNGYNTFTQKSGIIYFYLNHDGTVGTNESDIEVRPYIFYPNPATNLLHMQFSSDVLPKQVEFYDLQGRLVGRQDKTFESVDMSQLPAGTYTMRVTLENGKSFSDKVIKE